MNILNQMHFKSVCISKYQFSVDSNQIETKLTSPDNRTFLLYSSHSGRKVPASFLNILRKFPSEYLKFSITNDEFKYAVVPVLVQSCLKCASFVSRFSQCECLLSRPGRDLGVVTTS